MPSYRPFVVRIGQPEGDTYPLTAEFQGLQAHAGIPAAVLRQCLVDRAASPAPVDSAHDHLGSRLFSALFTGEISRLFATAQSWLGPDERLRVVLAQPLPDPLDDLPWELIFDAQGDPKSLRGAPNMPLVRFAPVAALPHQPPAGGVLRVLAVTAFPPGVIPAPSPAQALARSLSLRDTLRLLASDLEPAGLQETAWRLVRGRRYRVTVLESATRESVQDTLAAAVTAKVPFHVVHFFGQSADDDSLLLLNDSGGLERLSAPEFTDLFVTDALMVLAVTLCQEHPAGPALRGVAAEATQRGAPAVVGMQVPELVARVVDFSREFYRALAVGEPIELALAYGRRLVKQLHGPRLGLDLPAVYMAHTGGLSLPSLERVHIMPRAWRLLTWALATAFAIVGTTSGILDLPSFPSMLRARAPVIRCLWPNPMDSNRLTIAFLPLTVVNEGGLPTHGAAGHALADFLYQRFEPELANLGFDMPYEIRSPNLACQLPGRTAEERAAAARDYARRIGADILIYGVITDTVKADRMALAFNVDYRGYENADEIAGPFALGGSLPVTLPFDPEELLVIEHPPHLVRMSVLAELVVGLSYLRADNPEKALTYFDSAAADPYWPSVDGKEFAYFLKAQALTRQTSLTSLAEPIRAALEAYDTALAIKPDFTRAQLGKAGALVTFSTVQLAPDASRILDREKLGEAEAAYQAVVSNANHLTPLEWSTAHAGLGYVYLTGELYREPPYDFGRARAELELVRQAYESGQRDIGRVAGLTYGYFGLIANGEGDKESAIRYYNQALELVAPVSRAKYLSRIATLKCQLGDGATALDFASRAVDEARLYGRAAEVDAYTRGIEALRTAACP